MSSGMYDTTHKAANVLYTHTAGCVLYTQAHVCMCICSMCVCTRSACVLACLYLHMITCAACVLTRAYSIYMFACVGFMCVSCYNDPVIENCFYYHSERNHVVVLFATHKVQSIFPTEISVQMCVCVTVQT